VRRIYARVSHVYDFWAFASHSLRSYSEAQKMKVGLTGRKEELLPQLSILPSCPLLIPIRDQSTIKK
jgi:hypothetical protein